MSFEMLPDRQDPAHPFRAWASCEACGHAVRAGALVLWSEGAGGLYALRGAPLVACDAACLTVIRRFLQKQDHWQQMPLAEFLAGLVLGTNADVAGSLSDLMNAPGEPRLRTLVQGARPAKGGH